MVSPTVARFAAVPFGLFAFVGRWLVTFWVQPLTWRIEPASVAIAVALTALAVSVAVPLLLYSRVISPLRSRPTSMDVDANRSRFFVPASPHYAGLQTITFMWLGGGLVMVERVPNGDHMRVAEFPEAIPVSVIGVVLSFAVAALALFLNRHSVALEPTGLTIQRMRRQSKIRWEDLAPGGPPPPPKPSTKNMRLYFKSPQPKQPAFQDVPVAWLHVDPEFLAAAIRHYVEQPAQRTAIGTGTELTRLQSALAA